MIRKPGNYAVLQLSTGCERVRFGASPETSVMRGDLGPYPLFKGFRRGHLRGDLRFRVSLLRIPSSRFVACFTGREPLSALCQSSYHACFRASDQRQDRLGLAEGGGEDPSGSTSVRGCAEPGDARPLWGRPLVGGLLDGAARGCPSGHQARQHRHPLTDEAAEPVDPVRFLPRQCPAGQYPGRYTWLHGPVPGQPQAAALGPGMQSGTRQR